MDIVGKLARAIVSKLGFKFLVARNLLLGGNITVYVRCNKDGEKFHGELSLNMFKIPYTELGIDRTKINCIRISNNL